MSSSFTDFMREMEEEGRQAGPAVEAAFFESQQRNWIARLLFDRRRELGYTQAKLAALSGINQADISKIEHAEANPTLETLSALTTALECTLAIQPIPEEVRVVSAPRRPALIQQPVNAGPDRRLGRAMVSTRAAAAIATRAPRSKRAAASVRATSASPKVRRRKQ